MAAVLVRSAAKKRQSELHLSGQSARGLPRRNHRRTQRKGGAFIRHKKNGHFVLAIESGRHTDPATGNSYRTFALWKPEAPHANYIHDDELNEKYKAVAPDRACTWWTQKHATVPAIETVESHIIGGAIIPLWQRFKTQEDTRLRVVRVTTEDDQRIVGIQIPRDRVGTVLRSLGTVRDLRERDEIFHAILNEGEEISLVSNLKLRRGLIHREPAIELCGADPYKFAELRELGLINSQIDWKQRFFVPTDEERGIDILSALLDRYPVVVDEETATEASTADSDEIRPATIVDLDEWIVAVGEPNSVSEHQAEITEQAESNKPDDSAIFVLTQEVSSVHWTQLANQPSEFQLAFEFS